MKRFLILSLVVCAFLSCSDEKEEPITITIDPIIGTWKLEKFVEVDTDGTEVEATGDCFSKTTFIFKADGNATDEWFGGPNGAGECISDPVFSYKWTKKEDNVYELLPENQTSTRTLNVTFGENNTTFSTDEGRRVWRKQ
ncbi:lipocalin family protein [Tenacibaculum sp. M341]|uniref:lipocalin family protein n=1 Tax=Tenacibaculum sp. M341 TaxID=2530339 RepID=UPI001050BAC0|nr:lipocalin family protein [Tenacibaculum sp. M341]TCI92782.1 hypothetical protein EYW44_07750 [Tenacibaculum sp. M341]